MLGSTWVALACWLFIVVGILLQRFQLTHLGVSLGLFALGVLVGLGVAVKAALALKGGLTPVLGLTFVLGLFPLVITLVVLGKNATAPPIHDISTSPGQITFVHMGSLRGRSDNALDLPDEKVVAAQRKAYPNVAPLLISNANAKEVFDQAVAQAHAMGWQIEFQSGSTHFEALERTSLFGFVDDVAVEVKQAGSDVQVDVRSASRVGKGDFGANAQRIKTFLKSLNDRISDQS